MLKLCFLCQIVNARSLYWTNDKKLEMFDGWILLLSLSYLLPIHIKDMANAKPKLAKFTKSSHRESSTSIECISRI